MLVWTQVRQLDAGEPDMASHKSEMPQTYKDTIYVVRLLGVRYIWIDSLCIFQDDNDDWVQESRAMARI